MGERESMTQQKLWREKIPGLHNPAPQLIYAVEQVGNSARRHAFCCLLTLLLCLTYPLTTPAQGPAEVSTQLIPYASTVKCNQEDYNLFVVRAAMPASPTEQAGASALGIALVHTGNGEAKIFARYWFNFTRDPLLKRDDDNGTLGTKLIAFNESSFRENVDKFFRGCQADKEAGAVFQVLDKANPQSTVEDVVAAFGTNGLELKSEAVTGDQQLLNLPQTGDAAAQVLFARAIRASLTRQLENKASTASVVASPLNIPTTTGERSAASTELAATKKSLDEAASKINSLSTLLSILLGVLVTALFLCVVVFFLFYFSPTLQRKVFFRREDAAEIRRQAIDELYMAWGKISEPTEAQQKLGEMLQSYRQRFEEARDRPAAIRSTYHDFETDLSKFSLSLRVDKNPVADRKDDAELNAARQFINDHFGVEFVTKDLRMSLGDLSDELNKNLLPLAGNSNSKRRTLQQLKAVRQQIEGMLPNYSLEERPEGALVILKRQWDSFHDTLQPLKRIEPANPLGYAKEAVALFNIVREEFRYQPPKSEDLKSQVKRFFKILHELQFEHLPAEMHSGLIPTDILTRLRQALYGNKEAFDNLGRLNRAISDFQRDYPSDGDANPDSLDEAIKMVKHYKSALDLLKDYRSSDDRNNIARAVKTLQNKVQSAITAISKVMPGASGTIDEMVSSLVTDFRSKIELATKAEQFSAEVARLQGELTTSQTRAQDSTKLAGALSHYVNLSPDKELDPSEVQCILRRFNNGESPHRQLRLRLSAAIPALDRAIKDVRHAGREDALDALRVSDFMERLRGLLTNIEDFTGDAMWKDCLSAGFSQHWLHNLLRADLLARTYFAEDESLAPLVAPLSEASMALRAAISHFNVRVPVLSLLIKPPDGAHVDYEVDSKLSKLPEARRKVRAVWAQRNPAEKPNFIVDVESFPVRSEHGEDFGGRVIGLALAEWD